MYNANFFSEGSPRKGLDAGKSMLKEYNVFARSAGGGQDDADRFPVIVTLS